MASSPVLVVADDPASRSALEQALSETGASYQLVDSGDAAIELLEQTPHRLLILDTVRPPADDAPLLRHLRTRSLPEQSPWIAVTSVDSDKEVTRLLEQGAADVVSKPFRAVELATRIRLQLSLQGHVEQKSRREHDRRTLLELTQTLASHLDMHDILFTVVRRVAEIVRVDRCSIVLIGEDRKTGYVVATSDDEQIRDLPIQLDKYPEIREVLTTRSALVIEDVAHHPLLAAVHELEPGLAFSSMALVPILLDQGPLGVLCLRGRDAVDFSEYELSSAQVIANATGIALGNARILQDLKDETQQVAVARALAERRVLLFQRYADFFESAADGMVVIDRSGRVLFANPRAREIMGHSETQLINLSLTDLVTPRHAGRTERLLRGFADGRYPRGVDIELQTRAGDALTASVSFSSVLHENDAILLTFRDVTKERNTAKELEQTKDFLERVIESSVDAIVSADLKGRILLFNRAASRIFGYEPSEVLGKMQVEELYPPGVAREVMRCIRDPRLAGYGVLEDYRVDMLARNGERIQVTLSASLVMDGNRPVGSVGIFTDIRERLAMEAQLDQAQEELRMRERLSLVAELAGAAAHELNQPLTSVLGYAELTRRRLDDPTLIQNIDIIIAESERMAEIVRKVGRITRYETKSYVGSTKIVDLEKASAPDDPKNSP